MLQYYINRKKSGDKEEVQYTAPNHSNSGAEKLFFAIGKSTLKNFKEQVSQKGKRVISKFLFAYIFQPSLVIAVFVKVVISLYDYYIMWLYDYFGGTCFVSVLNAINQI